MAGIDDLFDTNLDDIEDLPEYADFVPTGHYTLEIADVKKDQVDVEDPEDAKKKVKADTLRVTYELVSIVEIKNEDEAGLIKTRESNDGKPGQRFSETFFFHKDPKKSAEIVKAKYKELAKANGWTTISEMIAGMKGLMITANVSSTTNKKDKEKHFINTKNIQPMA